MAASVILYQIRLSTKRSRIFFFFYLFTATAEAMAIGVLSAIVKVLGTKLEIEGVEKSKIKKFLDPLKKACKKHAFSFWGGLFLMFMIFNGLGAGGKESFDYFVGTILNEAEYGVWG